MIHDCVCAFLHSSFSALIMTIPFAVIIVLVIALVAGALALAAFVWAIRTKQFSIEQLNKGAYQIFDDEEPVGRPQDMLFQSTDIPVKNSRHGAQQDKT